VSTDNSKSLNYTSELAKLHKGADWLPSLNCVSFAAH
jgi:hypothetical protein